jgi:hypothetical protein
VVFSKSVGYVVREDSEVSGDVVSMQMNRRVTTGILAVVVLSLVLVGCIVVKDSPAPGCIQTIGFHPAGGCFGKTVIMDLSVEPQYECLDIAANNCNGGVLTVYNDCTEAFTLGGVTIAPGDRENLDIVKENGEHALVGVSSNFSDYVPETDESVQLTGILGSQEVQVVFSKTGPLCP